MEKLIASEIARALEQLPDLREYDRFQEIAFHIARSTWTGLRLTRKVHDRSADAIDNLDNMALACGWNGDLSKLRDDCRGLKTNRRNVKKVVFATSRVVEEPQVLKWKEAVKAEFGLELVEVLHRDSIVGELTRTAPVANRATNLHPFVRRAGRGRGPGATSIQPSKPI